MPESYPEQFVSEPISPEKGTFATDLMSRGLASLPTAFTWRNRRYVIVECMNHEKVSSPEGAKAGNEVYLRRQQFTVRLNTGQIARLYFQRQARAGQSREAAKQRWFLYTITSPELP